MIALAIDAPVPSTTDPLIVIFIPPFCPYKQLNETSEMSIKKKILIFMVTILNKMQVKVL
jgi:hypothetical protein